MSRILEADRQARWAQRAEQGAESRQNGRKWAVEAIVAQITQAQHEAAKRAVRETSAVWDAVRRDLGSPIVDCGGLTDYGLAAKVTASRKLIKLRHEVFMRLKDSEAEKCLEAICRRDTLEDVAVMLSLWRKMGRRNPIPDLRAAGRAVGRVLPVLENYYAVFDRDLQAWHKSGISMAV